MNDRREQPDDAGEADEPLEPEPVEPAAPTADELAAKVAQLNDRLLRVSADYQNYQKRMVRELADARQYARAELLKEFLTLVDDLERAMGAAAQSPDAAAIQDGVRITHEHLLALLARFGVTPINAVGEPFDPTRHEAMMRQPTRDLPPMTVVEELARGYLIDGRPLRPSRVVVAVEPEEREDQ